MGAYVAYEIGMLQSDTWNLPSGPLVGGKGEGMEASPPLRFGGEAVKGKGISQSKRGEKRGRGEPHSLLRSFHREGWDALFILQISEASETGMAKIGGGGLRKWHFFS